jgi:hypothetical protein
LSVIDACKDHAINDDIILTFCSRGHIPKLIKLLESFKKLNITNYIVVALDRQTHSIGIGLNSYLHPDNFNHPRAIWVARVEMISALVNSGINCLHADADSVFQKNPFKYLKELNKDICFGQGSTFPTRIFVKQNFVVRGGLHYTVSNEATKEIWNELNTLTKKYKDDQVAMNEYLYENASWDKASSEKGDLLYLNNKYKGFHDPVCGDIKETRICLLPHRLFSRYYTNIDSIMYHAE